MKEQDKTLEKYFNETKIKNLPDRKFKITVSMKLNELKNKMNRRNTLPKRLKF